MFGFFLGITFSFMAARYLYSENNKIDKTGAQQVIENLTVASFASPNISQWTNDAGYLSKIDYSHVSNGSGIFFDYRPNNDQCSNSQILRYDLANSRWVCADLGAGGTYTTWGNISGSLSSQTDLKTILDSKLSSNASLTGDVTGTLSASIVSDDSHLHTGTTISGLSPASFTSGNISQWTNDSNFILGVNFAQVTNASGIFLDYRPDNTACTQGQVLKYDAGLSRWICGMDSGAGAVVWGDLSGNMANQTDLNSSLTLKLGTTASFGGEVTGTYDAIIVTNDGHDHTGATISGLSTADFTSQNISQWTNDSGFISNDTSVPKDNLTNTGTLSFTWATTELESTVMAEGENISLLNNNAGFITGLNFAQVANAGGIYLNYKPNNVACDHGQTLKYDASLTRWACGDDVGAGTIAWGSLTGTLGDQGDLSTALSSKLNLTANFGGDVSGTYDNLIIANDSHNHTGATLTSIHVGQIVNVLGQYFSYKPSDVACADGEVLKYEAVSAHWLCGTDNTGGGTTTVGSMTGTTLFATNAADDDWLGLGASAARIEFDDLATDEINFLDAFVGIGQNAPTHKLDVNGNIGISASGYLNFGATDGTAGYGFRDNGGKVEVKNSGSTWKEVDDQPSWSINPDKPPTSANAMDDEFNDASIDGKWTSYTDAGGNASYTELNNLLTLQYTSSASNTSRLISKLQTVPGGNWKFRTKMYIEGVSATYIGGGLVVRNTSNNKTLMVNFMKHASYGDGFTGIILRMNGTTFSSETDLANLFSHIIYLEVEYDGTNIIFRSSASGMVYTTLHSETVANFLGTTPEFVGIGIHPWNTTSGIVMPTFSYDWFRRI